MDQQKKPSELKAFFYARTVPVAEYIKKGNPKAAL
jgi:hypothetical protein